MQTDTSPIEGAAAYPRLGFLIGDFTLLSSVSVSTMQRPWRLSCARCAAAAKMRSSSAGSSTSRQVAPRFKVTRYRDEDEDQGKRRLDSGDPEVRG